MLLVCTKIENPFEIRCFAREMDVIFLAFFTVVCGIYVLCFICILVPKEFYVADNQVGNENRKRQEKCEITIHGKLKSQIFKKSLPDEMMKKASNVFSRI